MQTSKKQYYDEQMAVWKSQFNPRPPHAPASARRTPPPIANGRSSKAPSPQQRAKRLSQSENNLPELVAKDGISPVNLRSHSDIRYHLNLLETTSYMDRKRADVYRRELDEQIRERERRRMMERQQSNGVELAPILLQRKSPSLPKLPNLSSTDVTRPFNVSPRLAAMKPLSPKSYYQELSIQQHCRMSEESRTRERDQQEAQTHFNNWELFWGRPGHGAPVRQNNKKENLFKLLHYHNINLQRK